MPEYPDEFVAVGGGESTPLIFLHRLRGFFHAFTGPVAMGFPLATHAPKLCEYLKLGKRIDDNVAIGRHGLESLVITVDGQ